MNNDQRRIARELKERLQSYDTPGIKPVPKKLLIDKKGLYVDTTA